MKTINSYMFEKLKIDANIKIDSKRENGIQNKPLYLSNNCITFPVILEIDHKYKENVVGYKTTDGDHWDFFAEDDMVKPLCSMTNKELISIFDNEKGIMLNTIYGWLPVIWKK